MRATFLSYTALSLVALVVAASTGAAQQQTAIRVGDFTRSAADGRTLVKDPAAPALFELPKGWVLLDGVRWGDHETTLKLKEVYSNIEASFYYQFPVRNPNPADPAAALWGAMEAKVRQRRDKEGMVDYHIRPDSVLSRTVAGKPALSFFADFTNPQGEPAVEYMLRVLGGNVKAHFFLASPATAELDAFVKRLDAVADSLRIG